MNKDEFIYIGGAVVYIIIAKITSVVMKKHSSSDFDISNAMFWPLFWIIFIFASLFGLIKKQIKKLIFKGE